MRYLNHYHHYFTANVPYFTTFFALGSILLSVNSFANYPKTAILSPNATESAILLRQVNINPDLTHAISAEFHALQSFTNQALDDYTPLALQTTSINAKRRALELALESNHLEMAYRITSLWVKQEPQDIPALLYLAHTSLLTQRYSQFVSVIDRILSMDADAQIDQIVKSVSPEREQDRLALLDSLYQLQQHHNPSLLLLIATLEAQNGQLHLALNTINQALKKRPNTTSFILFKANLLLALQQDKEALKWLKKSSNRYKYNIDVRLAEVQLLIKHKQEKEALKRLENTLKFNPTAEDALFLAGLTHIDHKNYAQAERYLLQLQHSIQYANDATYYLAINAERREHFDTAIAYYSNVEDHLYIAARQAIVRLLEQTGRINEALRFLTQERVNYPSYASFLYQAQAELLLKQQQSEQALALLQEASRDLPFDPDILFAQVPLLDPQQDRKQLEDILQRLIELEPNNPNYLNAYAYTLALQNRELDKARLYAEQALDQAPQQPAYLDTLGYIAFLQNDFTAAITHLKAAFEQNQQLSTALNYAKALYMHGDLTQFKQLIQYLQQHYPQQDDVQQLALLILEQLPPVSPTEQDTP